MAEIEFSADEKQTIVRKIQLYFDQELSQEIGQFDAEFLLDFFGEEVGAYFYNRGLADAQVIMEQQLEKFSEALYEIEKPTEFLR